MPCNERVRAEEGGFSPAESVGCLFTYQFTESDFLQLGILSMISQVFLKIQ